MLCDKQNLLPIGETDIPKQRKVKFYCPKCKELYGSANKRFENVDGAFIGTSFPHTFLLSFPELKPPPKIEFVPTVFGFKIHKSCANHPMKLDYDIVTNSFQLRPRPVAVFVPDEEIMPKSKGKDKDVQGGPAKITEGKKEGK